MCIYLFFLLLILILIIANYFDNKTFIKKSTINGMGLFTNVDLKKNETIISDVFPYGNKKDLLNDFTHDIIHEGKLINHCSINYNCDMELINDKYRLFTTKDIKSGSEIITNYDILQKKFSFVAPSKPHYKKC
jgi:hypothetical protein